jgi:hypothetical protein
VFAASAAQPVPPFTAERTPDTSVARFTAPVDIIPAVARTTPERAPTLRLPVRNVVEVALVVVAFVNTAVDALVAPIGVLLTVPPSIVSPFAMYVSAITLACHVPLVIVPTVAKLASVVKPGSVVVAESRLSKRVFVQYTFDVPSASASVVVAEKNW